MYIYTCIHVHKFTTPTISLWLLCTYVHVLINSLLIYYSKFFYNYYFGDLKEDKMPILAAFG